MTRSTTLILVILILVLSLKFNKKTEETINNEVSNEYIASYFDGEYQTEIPGKDDAYVVDKIVCDNGATATWNNEEWGINIRNATQKVKCSIYFKYQFEQDFNYTATEQVLTIPKSGTYKLEVWGAQCGSAYDYNGGYGGYSLGIITLNKNDTIYINVGGRGGSNKSFSNTGGYNGGGYSGENSDFGTYSYGGGGTTHIATMSGTLSALEDYKNNIIIVSGGGGGTYGPFSTNYSSGGGYLGVAGQTNISEYKTDGFYTGGGTQNGPGESRFNERSGQFGTGKIEFAYGFVGGGGFYGGSTGFGYSGGGGSGYIGNSQLTDKAMYCYNCEESSEESTKTISTTCAEETPTENCAKKGNGYA